MGEENHNKIQVLPDALADRIAAGEVVERPASVVKELMENALDAQALKIIVDIEKAGKKRIQVSDDGFGMTREDAKLAVRRHATSKISEENDLFEIRSMGFRGEALPSIASVSLFTLTTKAEEGEGTEIYIEGGEILREEPCAAVRGTTVEVRELFFNTPARKKFLKTDQTEASAIVEIVQRLALANPSVRFEYRHNGREILNLPSVESLHERAAGVFGKKTYPKLFPVEAEFQGLKIEGMISSPELSRPNAAKLNLFINRRPVREKLLIHAVVSAYGTMLEPKRYPTAAILLEMPFHLVDVNVHPAKTEVRFSDSRLVHRFVNESIREALGRSPWLNHGGQVDMRDADAPSLPSNVASAMAEYARREQAQRRFPYSGGAERYKQLYGQNQEGESDGKTVACDVPQSPGFFSSLIVLAQLHKTFILVSTPRGLGIIDQHAAHERIAFQKLKKQYDSGKPIQQMLLFPVRVELDKNQMYAFEEYREEIAKLGFEIEPFGGDSVKVLGVPELLAAGDPSEVIKELLDDFGALGASGALDERIDHLLSTVACHSVIRANDRLNYEQMEALLTNMDEIDFAASCPHGRPVFIEVSLTELERRFGRTS